MMIKILCALIRRPDARYIVWRHYTHPGRWTLVESLLIVGLPTTLLLYILWLVPTSILHMGGTGPIASMHLGKSGQVLISDSPGVIPKWNTLPEYPEVKAKTIETEDSNYPELDWNESYNSYNWSLPTSVGHCISADSHGNIANTGAACSSSGGSGTVWSTTVWTCSNWSAGAATCTR